MMTVTRLSTPPLADLLNTRFGRIASLGDHESQVLRRIEGRPRHSYQPRNRILLERSEIIAPQFIVSGWACKVRELKDGRRQIVSVLLPGDAIGLSLRPRPLSLTSIAALTELRTVEAQEMETIWRDRSRGGALSAGLDVIAAEEEYFMLASIMRLGRQTAYERTANFFLELDYRLSGRGLSTNGSFGFPLTQEIFADVVGLSVVHMNRTLQQMRREGRIELQRGRLTILDRDALAEAGEFSPPVVSAIHSQTHLRHGSEEGGKASMSLAHPPPQFQRP